MSNFKPNLYPNNKVDGTAIDWSNRIVEPSKWYISEKLDGIRVQIFFDENGRCSIKTRSLKSFRSVWIKQIESILQGITSGPFVVEGEIFCRDMMFNELVHFIMSENVESVGSIKKMTREKRNGNFANRDVKWLTTYDHDIKIHLFDIFYEGYPTIPFNNRLHLLREVYKTIKQPINRFALMTQLRIEELQGIINFYDSIVDDGGEGIILKHELNVYKKGRSTLREGTVFKMKDEYNEYSGIIVDVLEGTEVDSHIPTTTNELGRSVTSKSKFDRHPSGMAKGFLVDTDGRTLTVTLKGWDNYGKEKLLRNKLFYIGQNISYIAMKPAKVDGVPRQAKILRSSLP